MIPVTGTTPYGKWEASFNRANPSSESEIFLSQFLEIDFAEEGPECRLKRRAQKNRLCLALLEKVLAIVQRSSSLQQVHGKLNGIRDALHGDLYRVRNEQDRLAMVQEIQSATVEYFREFGIS